MCSGVPRGMCPAAADASTYDAATPPASSAAVGRARALTLAMRARFASAIALVVEASNLGERS